jgi:UDP-N-acetylmuramoyl-L-alanyl-D-glutamate--2,6-diaminopimelate ligase
MSDAAGGHAEIGTISSSDLAQQVSDARPLSGLLGALRGYEVRGDASIAVLALAYRSGDAVPGGLFFCVPGRKADGHDFAAEAVRNGAIALVVDRWLPLDVTQIRVGSVREAMGPMSAAFFGRPADTMTVIGVTGTNGKTTTTYLLESVFREAGLVPGVVGTTGVRIDGRPIPFPRTTPEAPDLHGLLVRMRERGVRAVAMEVSSHGLDQHRIDGILFACAVFTNLSQDHLDYHSSMEEYFEAKARLFTPEMTRRAVVNADSVEGRRLVRPDLPTLTFGLDRGADVRATEVETSSGGIAFRVGDVRVRSPLRGLFNVENCLATLGVARSIGIPDEVAARGIAAVRSVPGRLETVEAGQGFLVIVDYAHTPDSIESVLRAVRSLATGRLIVVFGCGGDRDRSKRPLMGAVAGRLADLSVITSDNPRSEDPLAIIAEIEEGVRGAGGSYLVEQDRRAAIRSAVGRARAGDVVVIAGKGHETYQEFADRRVPFDDRRVAAEELRALGKAER